MKDETRRKIADYIMEEADSIRDWIETEFKAEGDVIIRFVPKGKEDKEVIEATSLYT